MEAEQPFKLKFKSEFIAKNFLGMFSITNRFKHVTDDLYEPPIIFVEEI